VKKTGADRQKKRKTKKHLEKAKVVPSIYRESPKVTQPNKSKPVSEVD